jgi:peptidoglycan/LPS O-acetylase OafA/YrhL
MTRRGPTIAENDAERGAGRGAGRGALRADIQALRAVAVGVVLLYHLWPNRVPGGFVGVDVFFVISGFLIGGHLLSEVRETGRVRLGRFWVRRAKRLLPASLLVLLVVTVATFVVAPLSTRKGFLDEVVGSVLYVQNWVLADNAVDYLALGDAASPVQHYWSLSVEEQLYVALPLLLFLLALGSSGRARRLRLRLPVAVLAALAIASLAWSVLSTRTDAGIAYFSTATRAWEFLAGALLACVASRPAATVRIAMSVAGVVAVVAATFVLDDATPFPGSAALLPVAGAVLLIAAGDAGVLAWASRWRAVTLVGDLSYAIYLWHWPLIVLVPYATGHPLTTVEKLLILATTLVLSLVSTYGVENPVRYSPRLLGGRRARVVAAWAVAASVLVAGTALLGARASTDQQEELLADARARLESGDVRCLGAAALDPTVKGCDDLGDLLLPPPSTASLDGYNRTECWSTFGDSELHVCGVGPDDPQARRVLAIGDSHNNTYLVAYEEIADRLGWHIDVTGRAGCSWGTRPQGGRSETIAEECAVWKQNVAEHLKTFEPYDLILTVSDQAGYLAVPETGESARDATVTGLAEAWASQVERGTIVVAIRDWPRGRPDVVQCVELNPTDAVEQCSLPRDEAVPRFDAVRKAVVQTPGAAMVDLRDLMCTRERCLPVIGNVVVYRNSDHLTTTFVRTLVPYLVQRIDAATELARREVGQVRTGPLAP